MFLDRKTYELTLTKDDNGGIGIPKLKAYIFSTIPDKVKVGATLIKSDGKTEVEKIRTKKNWYLASWWRRAYHIII